MENNSFFDKEATRLYQEVTLDAVKSEEYKQSFANAIKCMDKTKLISSIESVPIRRRKPFAVRFREFIGRLMDTLS